MFEISVFSMVSKEINTYIVDYISTLAWRNKMITENFHHNTCFEERLTIGHYRDLGEWQFKFSFVLHCVFITILYLIHFYVPCLRFVVQEIHLVAANKGQAEVCLQQVFTGKKS